jgi:two-component system, OmpR family, sensor histidine kinase BaeS
MNSIAVRIIAAMLLVTLAAVGIPALITLFSAEQQFRQPGGRGREYSEVFRSVEVLCQSNPPVGLVCPKPRLNNSPDNRRRNDPPRTLPFTDPRPWVQQAVTAGVGVALVLAIGLALLLARRISHPIQLVSLAANKVAHGDLTARAKVSGQDELGQLAQNFNLMATGLEQQATARKNLFADIAHELRTPLTAMKARLEALEDGVMPLELEAIKRLSGQTRILEHLVEDLRLLSLADAGVLSLELQRTDLTSVAKDSLEHFRARAEAKNLHLEFQAASNLILPFDTNRIGQALSNLLENAIAHTPEGGTVTLEITKHPQFAQIRILDTGSGIPPESLNRIFERLYRADPSRNRSTGGSGLGLTIVKTIIELHGGTVQAANRPEGGAVFSLTLPLEPT